MLEIFIINILDNSVNICYNYTIIKYDMELIDMKLSENKKLELKNLWNKQIPIIMKELSSEELEYLLNEYYDFDDEEFLELLDGKLETVSIISNNYENIEDEGYQKITTIFKVNNTLYRMEWSYGGTMYPELTSIDSFYSIVKKYIINGKKRYMSDEEFTEYNERLPIISDKRKILGDNLNFLRKKAGLTYRDLSAKLLEKYNKRITVGAMNLIEKGKNYPIVENLLILSDFYNVGLEYLFTVH